MKYLNRRDGQAFTVALDTRTKSPFTAMIGEAVKLAMATDLYVVIDVAGVRVVVNDRSAPGQVASEWWAGPRMGNGNHIGAPYLDAYMTNDRVRALRLRNAPEMACNDATAWEANKRSNRRYAPINELTERWARLMQLRMTESRTHRLTSDMVHAALYEADVVGNVQAAQRAVNYRGFVLDALREHWQYSDEFTRIFR
jgi:hypothetical protein